MANIIAAKKVLRVIIVSFNRFLLLFLSLCNRQPSAFCFQRLAFCFLLPSAVVLFSAAKVRTFSGGFSVFTLKRQGSYPKVKGSFPIATQSVVRAKYLKEGSSALHWHKKIKADFALSDD
ncbi:MAG: hypothetical protein KBT39_02985 [Bacteroidales bacterium]|nr:hypothetical protein [Bacteroidales bacterium]